MAELNALVLNNIECGSGEMEDGMKTASDFATAHGHSEFVTTFEGGMQSSRCTTSAEERRAYRVWLEQEQRQCKSDEEFMTAISKPTWTELASLTSGSTEDLLSSVLPAEKLHEIHCTNQQFFQELIKNQRTRKRNGFKLQQSELTKPSDFEVIFGTPTFFIDFGGRLEVGKKIAQGGEAEIYETLFDGKNASYFGNSLVIKVFPLERSELFRRAWRKEAKSIYMQDIFFSTACFVMGCTLSKDGRFAFLMKKYWGDLRIAINVQILKDKTGLMPPFPPSKSTNIMYQIACGMQTLHDKGIVHRDLKATNVLVSYDIERWLRQSGDKIVDYISIDVADFETSEGVMGTRFWRAPEVLAILKSTTKDKYSNPTIWTKKVDVYAYGMTCYEVLSGCMPFQFRGASDYNIGDERPQLPDYVDQEIQELLRKCWDSEPLKRPTFEIICNELQRFTRRKIEYYKALAKDERDDEAKEWLRWPSQYIDESGAQ